ncbi:hypothetical protein [Bradyrhizobium sp. BRP23]|uniref:lipopolysaccharide biosynthesis protein n=1 Tax=Bradyrhizobium sp. BRP23 TaxID=2793820 RepID=UPI001CD23ACA|nr:hypothetical protein [Bradyrhizobium sp. BRP23]MCA1379283.1 hypothetical protein [Bradyrhizobium sp. BRP05]MCA1420547.1 hypothetical protein [Bradyrhizobium sp. BRP23]
MGKAWVLLIQLASVPILVSSWGASGYGVWLMLTAIPTYVALSDLGFGTAGGVSMIRRVAAGNLPAALRAFQSVWLFVSLISAAIWGLSSGLWLVSKDFPAWAAWHDERLPAAALLLTTYSLVVLQMNVVNMAFRSIGHYARGTFLLDIVSPVEQASVLAVASVGGGYVACAAAMLVVRVIGFIFYYAMLRRTAAWIHFGWTEARASEVRSLANSAMAALSLPVSSALSIQGSIFFVGLAISPAAAAVLGTIRMMARVPLQVVGLLTRATLPEITASEARNDKPYVDRLVYINLTALLLVTIPSAAALIVAGDQLLFWLGRGQMQASIVLFAVLTGNMILSTLWGTVGSFLLAMNQQQRFAAIYAATSVITAGLVYLAASNFGLEAAAIALLPLDAIMTFTVIHHWFRGHRQYDFAEHMRVTWQFARAMSIRLVPRQSS